MFEATAVAGKGEVEIDIRLPVNPTNLPFNFKRFQFPVKHVINKLQKKFVSPAERISDERVFPTTLGRSLKDGITKHLSIFL